MNLNLTTKLISLLNRIYQNIPRLDLPARLKRFNLNSPASILERCIFCIVDFAFILPATSLCFLSNEAFRNRICYLYEHPDHDDPDCFYPALKWRYPHLTIWIIDSLPKVRRFWHKCLQFYRGLKALVPKYKSSPSFFGPSPKLAVVVQGAGEWAEDLIPTGLRVIRVHYAPSFECGRYQADSDFEPMLAIDLTITRAGVDLDPLYSRWGLESVAFIVDNDFRPIFKPVNGRVLSTAAAYDLSKQFTTPVRVFEPEVSRYTIIKRKFHYPLFVFALFFISLLGLVLGEPTSRIYMCNIYGHRYADIYECISRWSNGPRNVIKIIFRPLFYFFRGVVLLVSGTVIFILLAIVKAIGWVYRTAVAAPNWLVRKSIAILESITLRILDAIGFVFSLRWKTLVIAIPTCWMLYLELRQMVVG